MLTLGLMSGTSMDGIDIALIKTDGQFFVAPLAQATFNYDSNYIILCKAAEFAMHQLDGDLDQVRKNYLSLLLDYLMKKFNLQKLEAEKKIEALTLYIRDELLSPGIILSFDHLITLSTDLHCRAVLRFLKEKKLNASDIQVIGYHGQTLYHQPKKQLTYQMGNGKQLATVTKIPVINDFRSADIKAGGQGAPLAPLYHQALLAKHQCWPCIIINCGGIANISFISGKEPENILGFDSGPGNVLIDRFIREKTQGKEHCDYNGYYGSRGKLNSEILKKLYINSLVADKENYFKLPPPKSLDSFDFKLIPELDSLSFVDAIKTLEAFTVDTIIESLLSFTSHDSKQIILVGGGWKNPVLFSLFKQQLSEKNLAHIPLHLGNKTPWNLDSVEAETFAYLAIRKLKNFPTSYPSMTRVPQPIVGGEIHQPET